MWQRNGTLLFSPSDLNHFVVCEHLSWLEKQRALGRLERDAVIDPNAELVAQKGKDHERVYLDILRAEGRQIVEIEGDPQDPQRPAQRTLSAMQAGIEVIYQAVLFDGEWLGIADFLHRVERPSAFGDWSYEVADTKLAHRTKPYFLLQLCSYSEQLARLQEFDPECMHVVLGTRERQSFLYRDFAAYYRRVRSRFLQSLGNGGERYPLPVEHCGICPWTLRCQSQWEKDDHLCLVANIRGEQIGRLRAAGIGTLAQLGRAPAKPRPRRMAPLTFDTLRDQARLQLLQRESGKATYELLPPQMGRGLSLLPSPSPGDVFFDMEGDPYVGDGLEYLFGFCHREGSGSGWQYHSKWAHDSGQEKRAFEEFIDFVTERRAVDPGLHVYHYAHYESTALKRLAARYGTREDALDDLLRGQVFVDLYRVVRQSLRASTPGYSIKELEVLYGVSRRGQVRKATESIVAYERWIENGEESALEQIALYNQEDCESTLGLRDWLLERREEAERQFQGYVVPLPSIALKPDAVRERAAAEQTDLVERLTRWNPSDLFDVPRDGDGRRLMAQLLDYHRRENRSAWWAYFDRLQMSDEDLVEDLESIGELEPDAERPPEPDQQSMVYTFRFPPQECKLSPGDKVIDPTTEKTVGAVSEIDFTRNVFRLRCSRKRGSTFPRSLVPAGPYTANEQKNALRRLAAVVADSGADEDGRYRAARDILFGLSPRIEGIAPGDPVQTSIVDEESAWPVVQRMRNGYLFVQGPPGSGKTCLAAQLIVRLLAQGRRVGVNALSHRAIHNLLHEVERLAVERRVIFRGLKKISADRPESAYKSKLNQSLIENTHENPQGFPAGYQFLAGTSWLFSREDLEESIDYLFVDEAGQISLADALAVSTSARNVVLLGDPQQLPQVSQGIHPEGSGGSVLEHLLGDRQTVPPDRGLFMSRTWRMHPEVSRFVSDTFYDGRLESGPGRERQRVESSGLSGSGIRYLPVNHTENSQRSEEEAEVILAEMHRLLEGSFTDCEGETRRLAIEDILVVAPYNLQVRTLQQRLPAGARVGTVDKFQGQQAPVVFFSMASSSGEDIPRGLEFLFSRNRLNVAISRAQALAILVASPRLLNVNCHTADQMRMVNALCRFVETVPAA